MCDDFVLKAEGLENGIVILKSKLLNFCSLTFTLLPLQIRAITRNVNF